MSTVLFIESYYHTERHFTRGFRVGAIRAGWRPEVVWLRDERKQFRPAPELAREIASHRPDLIMWIMDGVLPVAECLEADGVRAVPKVSMWFDDFERTAYIHRFTGKHRSLCARARLRTCVWDGYWRKQFKDRLSIPAYPIHLAADEVDYGPAEPTHFKGYDDSLIFIGNIPSREYLREQMALLPLPCAQMLEQVGRVIAESPYARLPYDALAEVQAGLQPKSRKIVEHFREDAGQDILVKRLAWMQGKRDVRLRILRLAARQRQVVILSGHSERTFASADELTCDIGGSACPVKFIATDHVPLHQIGCLYHIGGLHLQATDPQSVEGGIPFRVFETTASGRPLLSDFKPELAQCYKPGEEMLCYRDDRDFADCLSQALHQPELLRSVAEAGYRRFLAEHTWRNRFLQVAEAARSEGADA
ncbi:MAG: glycosyltransferase [Verrucomicrobiae bacterium]|nr:glycosyltransferase [Verrucomicrobiae bacterium]